MTTGRAERRVRLAWPLTGRREHEAVLEPLESGWVTQGPKTREFEAAFSALHHGRHAVATSSGTTALQLALLAAGVGEGDEVIVPSFTWVASANAVAYTGAIPVFADVDLRTYNITTDHVISRLSPRTRAVMIVHQFGQCADVGAIAEAVPDDVIIVEDAATAIGSRLRGKLAGTLTELAAFSFHPRKILTTGEGGMVLTSDEDIANKVGALRNHGMEPLVPNEQGRLGTIRTLGYNYRMTEMQAAIGTVQLTRLDHIVRERRRWANWYLQQLGGIDWLRLPSVPESCDPVWQAFVVVVEPTAPLHRDELAARLAEKGIETRPGTHAVADLDLYRDSAAQCPNSTFLELNSLAIPLHNRMVEDDYLYVADTLSTVG